MLKRTRAALALMTCAGALWSAQAQQVTGTPGSAGATTTISGKQLPPPDPKFGGVIKEDALQSKPWWAPRVVPPKSAPNVLLIITDDAGFGVPSTFGGVIPTPTMDRIAKEGLRYNRVFSTALCSPTRAALITGPQPPLGRLRRDLRAVDRLSRATTASSRKTRRPIGRILLDNGYATSWFGKDHNTPAFAASQVGPVRPVADRHGIRVLLRIRRGRCQPVGAQPLSQYDADLSVPGQAGLEPRHRAWRTMRSTT